MDPRLKSHRCVTTIAIFLLVMVAFARGAGADPITLMWDANAVADNVIGYKIYVGIQPGVYTQTIDVGNSLSYVFPDAVAGQRYYFAVAAYSAGPALGPRSTEVSGFSNEPPTLTNPGNRTNVAGTAITPLQLVGSDPDGGSVSYTVTGLPPGLALQGSTGLITGTGTTAGVFNVTVTVLDSAVPPLTAAQAFTWTMTAADTTAPAVAITAPTSAATFATTASTVGLSGTASDNVGVTRVSWTNNGGASTTATGTTSWSVASIALQAGANVIVVTAQDAAGNSTTDTLTVTRDSTAPAVAIALPTAAATYSTTASTVALSGTASDNVGVTSVSWTNNGGASTTATGTTSWSVASIALQAGTNVIVVTAQDAAGNSTTDTLTITRDSTAPAVAIALPTAAATYSTTASTVALSGTASDNIGVTSVSWTNNGGASTTATGTTSWSVASIALQAGANVIVVTAQDAAGNSTTDTLTVTRDSTAPAVAITAPTTAATYSTTASTLALSGTASDNVGVTSVSWTNNGGASTAATGTASWSVASIPLQVGANVIVVTAQDAAGNSTTGTLTVTRTDTTAPTVAITGPTTAATYSTAASTLALSGTASDNVGVTSVSWTSNGGASTAATGTTSWSIASVALQVGANVIVVTVQDAAGNSTTDTLTVTRTDTTAPTVAITAPTAAATYSTAAITLALSGTASDNVGVTSVSWTNNGGASTAATGTTSWSVASIALQVGANVIVVTAQDAAGNSTTDTLTVTRTDTTAPTVAITGPTTAATYSTAASTLALSGTASDNVGVTSVSWTNNGGASTAATGTTSWSVASIALQVGANVIVVTAQDAAGNTSTSTLTVTVAAPLTVTSLTSSLPSPQPTGTAITFTTTAAGGTGPYQYKYRLYDGAVYTVLRDWSTTATFTWTPTRANDYNLMVVWVRSAGATADTYEAYTYVMYPVTAGADTTAPTVAIAGPTTAATYSTTASTVALSGTASDNLAVTQVTWTNNRGGSGTAAGTTAWSVPAVALQSGSNVLTVTAADAAGNTSTATLTVTLTVAAPLTVTSLTSSLPSPQATGTAITFTTTATGGTAPYQYRYRLYDGAVYTVLRDWSTTATYTWTPAQANTNYLMVVWVRSAGATADTYEAYTYVTFPVTAGAADTTAPAVTITGPTTAATYSTAATTVALSGTASDNLAVTQVAWSNNRGGSGTATGTTAWSVPAVALQTGSNVLTVTAADAAGNTRTATLTVTLTVAAPLTVTSLTSSLPAPQPTGTAITFTTTATGGTAPYQYKYRLYDGAVYTVLRDWSTSPTYTWTPTHANDYNLMVVWVRSAGATADTYEAYTYVTFPVTAGAADTTAPAVTITGPTTGATYSTAATTVALSGTASDNLAVTQVTWTNNRGGSGTATGTTSWSVPAVALQTGSNVLTVTAADAAGNTSTATLTVTLTGAAPLTVTSLTSSLPAPQATGTAITFTTTATGGTAPYQYKYRLYDGAVYTVLRDWSTTATYTWTPAQANSNYLMVVWVRSAGATADTYEAYTYVTFPVTAGAADTTAPAVTITGPTTAATYSTAASTIALSGTASDNLAVTQVTWSNNRGGSGTATGTTAWSVPAVALQTGSNVLTVTAADAAGNTSTATLTVTLTGAAPLTVTSLTSSLPSPQPTGTAVTFTTTATGGTGPYQYKYRLYDGAVYTVLRDWRTSPTFTWTPTHANDYNLIVVWVRSAGATADTYEAYTYVMFPVTAGTADTTAPAVTITGPTTTGTYSTAASTIALSGTASDNLGVTQVTWTNNRGGSGTATGTTAWSVPAVALQTGSNVLTVTAADAAGNISTATLTVTLTGAAPLTVTSLTSSLPAPQSIGTAITFTATATGGTAPYQYKFRLYDGAVYTVLRDWSTSPTFTWTPTRANDYNLIVVWVRSAGATADTYEAYTYVMFPTNP